MLKSSRLLLRSWSLADASDLFEYAQREEVGPNAGWKPHRTEEESKQIIRLFLMKAEVYAILLPDLNKVIGSIGLHSYKGEKSSGLKELEIGFALHPDYWGLGIMPEAVQLILEHGFNQLDADVIWCGRFDFNDRSGRVQEKCGFTYRYKKMEQLKAFEEMTVTSLYYAITKAEYKERKRTESL
ncbi:MULTISPECIES: GNAT family N-acetyltransferase [unclassified Niallia]|uniref:GNAT family N-acetyltransferase n=1 Tax=unclassified Niallia TaxID=2837522 RepID=UPI001EDA1062|nr:MULTISPECIES: GNAT family N-acetyltransferase [unclassified Niallia]MDL0436127.1 GNAT family N-acetyltransferase [Niallia sp. SS-2023]UPO86134.1 GNAT family N-acetyltransferase [Niallia sp. Man26]